MVLPSWEKAQQNLKPEIKNQKQKQKPNNLPEIVQ